MYEVSSRETGPSGLKFANCVTLFDVLTSEYKLRRRFHLYPGHIFTQYMYVIMTSHKCPGIFRTNFGTRVLTYNFFVECCNFFCVMNFRFGMLEGYEI